MRTTRLARPIVPRISTLVLTACVVCGIVESVFAGPLYEVTVQGNVTGFGGTQQSASPGIVLQDSFDLMSVPFPSRIDRGTGLAQANQGRLGASIDAEHNFTAGSNRELGASAELTYDDILFSSSDGLPINVTLPLHLSGSLTTSAVATRVIVQAKLAGQNKSGAYRPALGEASGLLSTLSGGTIDTTIFATYTNVPTNTPTTLHLFLSTDMFINGDHTAFADFASTFGFVTDGPAFIVPNGINVDSQQGAIVDNQFLIPEPSTLVLASLAALGLCVWRRRFCRV